MPEPGQGPRGLPPAPTDTRYPSEAVRGHAIHRPRQGQWPRGGSALKRAIAWMRALMLRPPLAMEECRGRGRSGRRPWTGESRRRRGAPPPPAAPAPAGHRGPRSRLSSGRSSVPDQWVAPVQAPQGAHPHPGPHVAMAEVEQLVEEHLCRHRPVGERQHRAQGPQTKALSSPGSITPPAGGLQAVPRRYALHLGQHTPGGGEAPRGWQRAGACRTGKNHRASRSTPAA